MKFIEQLYEAENEQITKKQTQISSFDDRLLSSVIDTIKRECNHNVEKHRLVGHFDNDTYLGDPPSIQSSDKKRIPKIFDADRYLPTPVIGSAVCFKGYRSFLIKNPSHFKDCLKQEISNLGFNSSNCTLIPVQVRKPNGTSFGGWI